MMFSINVLRDVSIDDVFIKIEIKRKYLVT